MSGRNKSKGLDLAVTLLESPETRLAGLFPLLGANLIRARLIPLSLLPPAESLLRARVRKTKKGTVAPAKGKKDVTKACREARDRKRDCLSY